FKINLKLDIPQQSNSTDYGLFVMKYMESIFLSELTAKGFNADDVRLKLLALISKGDDHKANLEGPVHSPKKSPVDPRFATKKLKAQNMFTGTSPAYRTQNAK
ncbi:hypothetical protein PanWU01x14_319300, partial [Parasponia andersonii]